MTPAAPHPPDLVRRLLRARDRMDAASAQAWPISRLARVSGTSEAHFARAFKDIFGIPPHRYLLTRRVERAAALLRETDLPITDIALASGWKSLGSFGRTFKDILGLSPGEYRAQPESPLVGVPVCYLRAAARPDLQIAVLEKRRQEADATPGGTTMEVPCLKVSE